MTDDIFFSVNKGVAVLIDWIYTELSPSYEIVEERLFFPTTHERKAILSFVLLRG